MQDIQDHPLFEPRPCGPRTYRPIRHRTRVRFAVDTRSPVRRIGEKKRQMEGPRDDSIDTDTLELGDEIVVDEDEAFLKPADKIVADEDETFLDRKSLCLPHFEKDTVVHGGDEGFQDVLRQYFPSAENTASERLVELKAKLKSASTHEFWELLMEGMCDTMGAQCGFVAKRMLVDDQDSAVEMPPLGQPGSCLMGVAFYVNDGTEKKYSRDYRYHAYGTPCANMRYDKVFIVPARMSEFVRDNPNKMPWDKSEAFIGVPLFTEGKCFAHFGMIWSSEGAKKRPKCNWSFIEMFLHSLEDMILDRLLTGRGFAKSVEPPESTAAKIIPLSAITASQSLKPYARSLSHELRTPMQGVVGMLDIMYSTVLDAMAVQQSERVRSVFKDLKNHIEVVQDSSRRAVEAADNVVHAYDLNMQMPETPLTPNNPDTRKSLPVYSASLSSPHQKKRVHSEEPGQLVEPSPKRRNISGEADGSRPSQSNESTPSIETPPNAVHEVAVSIQGSSDNGVADDRIHDRPSPMMSPALMSPSLRQVVTRDFMRTIVHQALRNGHPTKEMHKDTELGEIIEVQTLGTRGEVQRRTVSVEIDVDVPEAIITEEQHLQFALQKLVDNAIKFTEEGRIRIAVKIADGGQVVEIWVVDTGCGIAEDSRSQLFTPHFQEDTSISRSKDGLGLSLFNAKAHVRKNLGGDVTLERSDTEGLLRGSEFLIRLPLSTLPFGSNETPIVGTPIVGTHLRHLTLTEPALTSPPNLSPRPSTINLPLQSPGTPRRNGINPSLAAEYPLNFLIAEDNPTNRNVAIGALKRLGYKDENITVAFDGIEAVESYQRSLSGQGSRFQVVLMDIWMPRCDGYQATQQILELARKGNVEAEFKVVAVTADITEECFERAKEAGMQALLAKPYKVLDVERLIVEHFGGWRRC